MSSPYDVLGVSESASQQEIEAAFRRAALERRYQDGSWVELRDAYDVLRDPEERARYDLGLDGAGADEASKSRNPIDRLFPNLPHGWRVAIDWVVTIVGAVAIVLAIKAWIVNPYRIPSSSMEPTLRCAVPSSGCESRTSDRVLACRFCYHFRSPHRGDIVVFNTPSLARQACGGPGGTFVKRLIGLPGEVWEEREGFVYINGKKLNEPYIKPDRRDDRTMGLSDLPPRNTYTRIPSNYYLMMGDNRRSSCDSRVWGLVPRKNLIGNVFATYWPPSRVSLH